MKSGWREGRNPSPAFNTLYYRDRHLAGVLMNPLSHYAESGLTEGLSTKPSSEAEFLDVQRPLVRPHFNLGSYATQIGRLSDQPLDHYLAIGWRTGHSPSPNFLPNVYFAQHAYVKELGISPLYHFASQLRMLEVQSKGLKRPPRPVVLANQVRDLIAQAFDGDYYLKTYLDVAQSNHDPLDHYIEHGWREGRNPSPLFDSKYYLAAHADVRRSGLNPFYHFLEIGKVEGRLGNPVGTRLYPPLETFPHCDWDQVASAVSTETADYVIIMPVYKGFGETLTAIHAVLAAPQECNFALHVINDRGPDPALNAALKRLADRGLFSYDENETNLGFVRTVNKGMRLFADKDLILLNSDTQVFGDWLDRIDRHAKADPSIATITPLSNNATICSYPVFAKDNVIEPEVTARVLDAMASRCNAGRVSDIPTGVGFCFYISRASRYSVGVFDEEAFGRGYGEENDFCLRAAKAGFRNVVAEDLFVYHAGQVSFAEFRDEEYGPGQKALLRKHPDYAQRVSDYLHDDAGEVGRIRLDLYRLARSFASNAMVFASHAIGGGIDTHLKKMEDALRDEGIAVVNLRLGRSDRWSLEIASPSKGAPYCPNLRPFAFNHIRPLLIEFLGWLKPKGIHIHSLVGFDWTPTRDFLDLVRDTKLPYFFTLHDYSVVCHRANLVRPDGLFCDLPDVDVCRACVAVDRDYPEALDPLVRRQTFDGFLHHATAVFAPSRDIKARLERAGAAYAIDVRPHDDPAVAIEPASRQVRVSAEVPAPIDIVTIGAVGRHKGSRIILNLARDAQARGLPIRFHIIGYSDITGLLAEAGVMETGLYENDAEAADLVRTINPAFIFLPSIWPETFSFVLSMAFALDVPPIVFDLGAQRDRVVQAGFGIVMPYALINDVTGLNDRLLALPLDRAQAAPDRKPTFYPDILRDYYGFVLNA